MAEELTHDLSDGHGLSQRGGGTGPRHVVGPHAELQPVSGGEIPDDQRCPVRQTLNDGYPLIRCDVDTRSDVIGWSEILNHGSRNDVILLPSLQYSTP